MKKYFSLVLVFVFVFGSLYSFFVKPVFAEDREGDKSSEIEKSGEDGDKNDDSSKVESSIKNDDSKDAEDINDDDSDINKNDDTEDDSVAGSSHKKMKVIVGDLEKISKDHSVISEKVKEVTKETDDSKEKIFEATKKVEERGGFKTFLIGSDYKNIGVIRSELARARNTLEKLQKISDGINDTTIKADLAEQSKAIQSEIDTIEGFVNKNESRFSLFGWFVKLFE